MKRNSSLIRRRQQHVGVLSDDMWMAHGRPRRKKKRLTHRISSYGLCDLTERHGPHTDYPADPNLGGWSCPGQYAECRNCDDRKCMGCVFREYDHECADDCPFCCGGDE